MGYEDWTGLVTELKWLKETTDVVSLRITSQHSLNEEAVSGPNPWVTAVPSVLPQSVEGTCRPLSDVVLTGPSWKGGGGLANGEWGHWNSCWYPLRPKLFRW